MNEVHPPNCITLRGGWRAVINFLVQTLFPELTKMVQSPRKHLIRSDAEIFSADLMVKSSTKNHGKLGDMQISCHIFWYTKLRIWGSKLNANFFLPVLNLEVGVLNLGSETFNCNYLLLYLTCLFYSMRIAPGLNAKQNWLLNLPHLLTQVNFP